MFDAERMRDDFPVLGRSSEGPNLVYLDVASDALRPQVVVDAVAHAHAWGTAGAHRASHTLALRATEAYERARARVASFLNADCDEVVFVRSATDALNSVASGFAAHWLGAGDEVVLTELEHHSNTLPWRRAAQRAGARLVVVGCAELAADGSAAFVRHLSPKTRLVTFTHVSNVLGVRLNVAEIVSCVRKHAPSAAVVVDGAQAAGHMPVDVKALDCDFYAFSSHKCYGPEGIGVLWGRRELLARMEPPQLGGGMVSSVEATSMRMREAPHRFEAGTPNVAGALGLEAALNYLSQTNREAVAAHEAALVQYADRALCAVPGVQVLGQARDRTSVLSFVMTGVHAHDLSTVADAHGVAIRAGQHCAEPLLRSLGLSATARLSVGLYSTHADIDALAAAMRHAADLLR
jgi:cysteine desulfurase/selenocysteine lyase